MRITGEEIHPGDRGGLGSMDNFNGYLLKAGTGMIDSQGSKISVQDKAEFSIHRSGEVHIGHYDGSYTTQNGSRMLMVNGRTNTPETAAMAASSLVEFRRHSQSGSQVYGNAMLRMAVNDVAGGSASWIEFNHGTKADATSANFNLFL